MKWICFVSFFCVAWITGLSAQHAVDSVPAAGAPLLFNEDSLYLESLALRASLAAEMAKVDIRYFIIRVPDEKFGYSIFIDGMIYIEQKSIPAIEGNAGFNTKEDAEKVAKRVIEKIKRGETLPTLDVKELQELGVLNGKQ